jgi:ethanolamine utilization microcompartment shell protein EutS
VNAAAELAAASAAVATACFLAAAVGALALAGSFRALEATTNPTVSTSNRVEPTMAARQSRSDLLRSTGQY